MGLLALILALGPACTAHAQAPDVLILADMEGDFARFRGVERDTELFRSGTASARWADHPRNTTARFEGIPSDWTEHDNLEFWLYSEVANDARFMLIISSNNPETDGIDYWSYGVRVNWTGWRHFRLRLAGLRHARQPRGWDQVDHIYFTASGWNNAPQPDTRIWIDDIRLTRDLVEASPVSVTRAVREGEVRGTWQVEVRSRAQDERVLHAFGERWAGTRPTVEPMWLTLPPDGVGHVTVTVQFPREMMEQPEAMARRVAALRIASGDEVPEEAYLVSLSPDELYLPDNILDGLRLERPRLVCTEEDLARIMSLIETDETAARYWQDVHGAAERLLDQPTVVYEIVGPRLLTQSRRCLERVYTLALAYRLSGDERFAERAVGEMLAAAAFPDWNPSHFLDTAEMTHALAVGYDWLYEEMTARQREAIREAIVGHGLRAGLEAYEGTGWWPRSTHNWNQVCNGGMIIGALAVADEEPELALRILREARKSLPRAMQSFAPDGGWNEGPGYWGYTTRYTVALLAALESALGDDLAVSRFEGFERTGFFRMEFVGPTGLSFNYADAGERAGSAPQMFWLARRFDQPAWAWHQRQSMGRAAPQDLIWYDPRGEDPVQEGVPLDVRYRGVDVAFFRSDWLDPDAIFVGFKGGDNKANHSHLDLGSFVLDAQGQRFATDLGPDNYNLPGFFGHLRWTYYRLRTESHNTVLINNENQLPTAAAPIIAFRSEGRRAHAIADLSAAYDQVRRMERGMAMLERRAVLVQDEIEAADEPVEALWGMLTFADVALDGAHARLTRNGKLLQARILEPEGAVFDTVSANPPPPQRQQPDAKKLVVRLPDRVTETRIVVLLWPGEAEGPEVEVQPLDRWLRDVVGF